MDTNRPVTAAPRAFSLNLDEAVRSIFRDPDWLKKIALGSLFSFLSIFLIGYFFVQGYLLTLGERVARGETRPLPEWEDYGELLRRGALGIVVSLVYSIPILAIGVVLGLLFIPLIVIAGSASADPDMLGGVVTIGYCGGLALFMLLALLISVVAPAAHVQLILHNHDLGAAFRFGEVFGFIGRHRGQYALMTIVVLAATYGLAQVGQCACYVGVFATVFIAQLFQYHLLGQFCWYERQTLGERPEVP